MAPSVEAIAVRRFATFEDLREADLAVAARSLVSVTLGPGQKLFSQGDWGSSAYVVVSGCLDVRATGRGGDEHHLATLQPGHAFGELGLLVDRPRSATIAAQDAVELWEVTRRAFRAALDRGDAWATRFLLAAATHLAESLAATNERLVALLDAGGSTAGSGPTRVPEMEQLRERLFREWSF